MHGGLTSHRLLDASPTGSVKRAFRVSECIAALAGPKWAVAAAASVLTVHPPAYRCCRILYINARAGQQVLRASQVRSSAQDWLETCVFLWCWLVSGHFWPSRPPPGRPTAWLGAPQHREHSGAGFLRGGGLAAPQSRRNGFGGAYYPTSPRDAARPFAVPLPAPTWDSSAWASIIISTGQAVNFGLDCYTDSTACRYERTRVRNM